MAFLWMTGFGLLSLSANDDFSFLCARVAYVGIPLLSPAVFLFSEFWVNGRARILPLTALASGIALTIPPCLNPRGLFQLVDHDWGRYIEVSQTGSVVAYYSILFACFLVFGTLALLNFYRGWKLASDPLRRIQFRSVFLAFLIAYVGSIDFAVKMGIKLYPSGYLWLSGLIAFIAYTILRHRTMDIDLARNRWGLLCLIYSALVAIALPIVFPIAREVFSGIHPGAAIGMTGLIIAGGLFLSTGPAIYAYLVGQQFWLKGQVTSAITHELKSPIGAIRGATENLRDSTNPNDLKAGSYLAMLERNTDRLEQYVASLLTVLRMRENDLTARRTTCDILEIINQAKDDLSDSAASKGLFITLEISPCPTLIIDPGAILLVLTNLISNSIKFSARGTITITASVINRNLSVTVTDEGVGIPERDIPYIFDQFFQGNSVTKGSGLGLAIAKGWVEAHGGQIWAESKGEGRGTRMTINLPING